MKSLCIPVLLIAFVPFCSSQPSAHTYVSSVSNVDRLALVKGSIDLTEWHEKSFWEQYDTYLSQSQELSAHLYVSMQDLAQIDAGTDTAEASHRARLVLDLARQDLAVMSKSYQEISRDHNGVIALQFLQAETQLGLMEGTFVYDGTALKKYRLKPGLITAKGEIRTRYNVLAKSMDLTMRQSEVMYPIYSRYQAECNDVLGNDYNIYELFAVVATDYSPGLAKRIGYDMLTVAKRELELKEKYFNEFRRHAGPVMAARFLAWEDYYSFVCKMTLWAETN